MKQQENEYYVYFYNRKYKYCDDVFDIVNQYLHDPIDLPLYVCELDENCLIFRSAESGNWQGPGGKYYVDWVNIYEQLFIAGVPSLIRVRYNGVLKECFYVTSGKNGITDFFEELTIK